jgi:hypothetical protein
MLLISLGFTAQAEDGTSLIQHFQNLKKQTTQKIEATNGQITEKLMKLGSLNPKIISSESIDEEYKVSESEIKLLLKQKEELQLRHHFCDRVIFQIDTSFSNQEEQIFFSQTFLEMANQELKSPYGEKKMWRFLTYLSQAVRDFPEPGESILGFINNYLEFSTIQEPKMPNVFIEHRDYTNGFESQAASDPNLDQLPDEDDYNSTTTE